jgi:anti-anti-sigma regulatory factor
MPPAWNEPAQPDGAALCLPPSLDLTRADALRSELLACLARGGPLQIDGSAVDRVSTACVQLLVAASVSVRERGGIFELAMPSAVLRHAIRDLGLAPCLGTEAM